MTSARICLQWTLIVFNTFTMILGSLAVIGGAFEVKKCLDGTADCPIKIAQIVMAGILIISAFVGCCGSINGSIKTLCVFAGILLVMMVAHGWILWRYDESKQNILVEKMVRDLWMGELVNGGAMDDIQKKYECCGKYGKLDYISGNSNISESCYPPNTILHNNPYPKGCIPAVQNSYLKFYRYEYWSHIGLIIFEFVGVLLTSVLVWKLMAKTRRYHY